MNTYKVVIICISTVFIGISCGPLPSVNNLTDEIKGSAVRDIDEAKKKELEDLGTQSFNDLKPEDQAKAAKILNDQVQLDPKKLGKQYCHLLALSELDKAKAEKMRADCVKKIESGETKVNTEDMKKYFINSGLSPAELSKAIKATGEILGSPEIAGAKLGASEGEKKNAQEKVKSIAEKSGLPAQKVMGFAMGLLGSMFPNSEPQGQEKGPAMAGPVPSYGPAGEVGPEKGVKGPSISVGPPKEKGHGAESAGPEKEEKGHDEETAAPKNEAEAIKALKNQVDARADELAESARDQAKKFVGGVSAAKKAHLWVLKELPPIKNQLQALEPIFAAAGLSKKGKEEVVNYLLKTVQGKL